MILGKPLTRLCRIGVVTFSAEADGIHLATGPLSSRYGLTRYRNTSIYLYSYTYQYMYRYSVAVSSWYFVISDGIRLWRRGARGTD